MCLVYRAKILLAFRLIRFNLMLENRLSFFGESAFNNIGNSIHMVFSVIHIPNRNIFRMFLILN